MDFSEILKIVEVVIIPITAFLVKEIFDVKKDLAEMKVYCAKTYVNNACLVRLEQKLDDLRYLFIKISLNDKEKD